MTEDTYFCNFLQDAMFNSRKIADYNNYEMASVNFDSTDTAILDGQQRLTSLYLSLRGKVSIRQKHSRRSNPEANNAGLRIELDETKISTSEEEYNSKKYDIKFTDKLGQESSTQFKIKNIMEDRFKNIETREKAIEDSIINVSYKSKEYAYDILHKLCKAVYDDKIIRYTEIQNMKQDDALEIFVRFNSGGKALKKSEIKMSILEAYWPQGRREFGKILVGPYKTFDSDFIISASIMLYGDVSKFNLNKTVAEALKIDWGNFKETLNKLAEVLEKLEIDIEKFNNRFNILLPIIYFIYFNTEYERNLLAIKSYFIRAILFKHFQAGTIDKLAKMRGKIYNSNYEINIDMLESIDKLRVTDGKIEDILNSEKGDRVAYDALYFLSKRWLKKDVKYEQDHLHPYNRFDLINFNNPSREERMIWRNNRNRLPNLHLLEKGVNISKSDKNLLDYYNEMTYEQQEEFKRNSFIPEDIPLEFRYFGKFYKQRKAKLFKALKDLLS